MRDFGSISLVASQNPMVSCDTHCLKGKLNFAATTMPLPPNAFERQHFPRLSLTQSVVFSWDHTHQVCLALVLQGSLASQLPL